MVNIEQRSLAEIADAITELLNVTKVINYEQIKALLETILDTREKRLVYELSDGSKTVRDISKLSGVNISSISTWSQYWEQIGLLLPVKEPDVKGRRKKIFSLVPYGLKVEI